MNNENIKIIDFVTQHYKNVISIYLFGSYGTSNQNSESDIDIAVLFAYSSDNKASNIGVSECAVSITDELNRNVDLINLQAVNTVFQYQIITTGRLIFCSDNYQKDVFEMQVLSAYQKLNEERAEIIEEILKSGKVLG